MASMVFSGCFREPENTVHQSPDRKLVYPKYQYGIEYKDCEEMAVMHWKRGYV